MSSTCEPRVAVVVPTYNRRDLLPRALGSVFSQSLSHFELIVADDGSSDTTADYLASLSDSRLRTLRLERSGVSAARNRGAAVARSPILTFLDSDDEALPSWLERMVDVFEDPEVGVACCGHIASSSNGDTLRVEPRTQGPIFEGQPGPFLAGTFAVRRDLFEAVGGYDEKLTYSENTELAMRLAPAARERGMRTSAVMEALVVIHATRPAVPEAGWLRRCLESSEYLLERHATLLHRDGHVHALLLATAGVRAARLGEYQKAQAFFRDAVRADPRSLRHRGRLFLAAFRPLARRVWRSPLQGTPS